MITKYVIKKKQETIISRKMGYVVADNAEEALAEYDAGRFTPPKDAELRKITDRHLMVEEVGEENDK